MLTTSLPLMPYKSLFIGPRFDLMSVVFADVIPRNDSESMGNLGSATFLAVHQLGNDQLWALSHMQVGGAWQGLVWSGLVWCVPCAAIYARSYAHVCTLRMLHALPTKLRM